MRYAEVSPMSRQEAEAAFATGSDDRIVEALLSVAYHDDDWHWVQSQCLCFARHPSVAIRRVAVTCLGHLARLHGALALETVLPLLDELAKEPTLSGQVEDALDDIGLFIAKTVPAR